MAAPDRGYMIVCQTHTLHRDFSFDAVNKLQRDGIEFEWKARDTGDYCNNQSILFSLIRPAYYAILKKTNKSVQ